MIQPSLDKLAELVDSKYTLVVMAAKRAREIVGDDVADGSKSGNPVTMSLHEISSGKVAYERTRAGIK